MAALGRAPLAPKPALSAPEARALTEEVKGDARALWAKLLRLYAGGAHTALGYASWGDYCGAELGMSDGRAYQLLGAARVVQRLTTVRPDLPPPANEAQARALLQAPPEAQVAVWTAVVEEATAAGIPVTAERVTAVVTRRPEPAGPPVAPGSSLALSPRRGVRAEVRCVPWQELLGGLDDESVDVIWTSPNYNLGDPLRGGNSAETHVRHQYAADGIALLEGSGQGDGHLVDEAEYQDEQEALLAACRRVLRPGGVLFYSHKDRIKDGESVHPRDWVRRVPGLHVLQDVVWNRGGSAQNDPRRCYPAHEVLLILARTPGLRLHNPGRQSGGQGLTDVWSDIRHPPGETRDDRGHPAAAPIPYVTRSLSLLPRELHADAEREGRRLLAVDPYAGRGTTGIAAARLGMDSVLGEVSPTYAALAAANLRAEQDRLQALEASPLPTTPGGWQLIVADPPWPFAARSAKGLSRAPERHYATMPVAEIMALPVAAIAAPHGALALWATPPHLANAQAVLEAWGYRYVTYLTWVKPSREGGFRVGTGLHVRGNAELLLLGRRGEGLPLADGPVEGLIVAERREHSRKPDEAFARLEALYGPDVTRLELFARERRPGYESWGLETETFTAPLGGAARPLRLIEEAAG